MNVRYQMEDMETIAELTRQGACQEAMKYLEKKGWKKSTQNRGEEIKLADEYAEWAEKRKYPKDRRGRLMKINDRARIRFLRGYEQEREKLRKNRRKDVTVQM